MGPEKQPQELTMLIDKLVGSWDVEMTVKLVDGAILRGKVKLKAQEIVDGFGVRTEKDELLQWLGMAVMMRQH